MKKFKIWSILMLTAMMMPLVASCGDDDEKNANDADIAITGSCIEVGGDYARIDGYFNQKNVTASYSSLRVGIEYSMDESFSPSGFVQTEVLEGNKFEVKITGLKQSTVYYYRTCVKVDALNYVGKTSKFTTIEGGKESKDYPDYKADTKVYFAYQNPIRTLILGNDIYDNELDNAHKCRIWSTTGGAYNGSDVVVDVIIDESLCENLWFTDNDGNITKPVLPLPHDYYNYDEVRNAVIRYNGETRGYLEIHFTDKFFQDPKTTCNDATYVIPVRMTKVTGNVAILSGTPNTSNPVRQNEKDWTELPKDYVLYCVRYMNPWQGKYIRRGVDNVVEKGVPTTVVRRDVSLVNSDPEHYKENPVNQNDEICEIKTKNMTQAIFPVSFKTSGASILCNLVLTFSGDKCTISTADEGVTATGSGEFIAKGTEKPEYKDYQWGSSEWHPVQHDILRLSYDVNFANSDIQVSTNDTLVVQTRESNQNTMFDYKYIK